MELCPAWFSDLYPFAKQLRDLLRTGLESYRSVVCFGDFCFGKITYSAANFFVFLFVQLYVFVFVAIGIHVCKEDYGV